MDFYENWFEEKRSAYLYSVMAENETNIIHKKLFTDLQEAANKQAQIWEKKMLAMNQRPPTFTPNFRTRLVAWLTKCIGTESMHNILSAMKIRGLSVFSYAHTEHKHTSLNSASNLRAAVFGINDGLISNMSLILGIAGANSNQTFILIAGVAGLLAGACSMGAGEYISVRSQREVFEYQIGIERQELAEYPEEEAEELTLIYEARGLPKEEASKLAQFMTDNPERGLDALAREELGLNPSDLVSPIGAMFSSFFSFAFGAAVPLVPFVFSNSPLNLYVSMLLTAIVLFVVGMTLSLFTNRNPFFLGLRMLLIGIIAGAITFSIGKLLGISMF